MKQRGFTLIEVMIAMAIFAVSTMAILSATGENINALGTLERKTLASIIADNQMAIMMLEGVPSGERSGNTEMAGENWHWTIRPEATVSNELKAIDLIVWTNEKRRSSLISVRTYVVQ